ncbi:2400_t:CDS:2 [Ambispora gerdemannii]|uniref:2400_t:CDS:1 n=1 Tax=Ambispora gerdemannii TaxID=144530 RepID=A0A9N9FE03_9GLOM|nr:2400_t:CDS:2 [Ambispora gerdemannii]
MVNDQTPINDPFLPPTTDPSLINDAFANLDAAVIEEEETVMMQGKVGSPNIAIPSPQKKDIFSSHDRNNNNHNGNSSQEKPFLVDDDKGKGKENYENLVPLGSDSLNGSTSTLQQDKFKSSNIPFGKQQDVTECMDNVMFQLEAALKPTINKFDTVIDTTEANVVKR